MELDSGSSPSFSFYSSNTLISTAIARAIREDEDFEFSLPSTHQQVSSKEIDLKSWNVFPVFNRDLLINDANEEREGSESPSYSSSEADELENVPSGTFCVWSPKASSSPKCKKSNSTGSSSGSKKWKIRDLLGRSNSEGKEPMVLLNNNHKKVDISRKQKHNPGEVSKVGRRLKTQTPVHELFYVQKRAENEVGKRKSFLPYRQDLVGLFGNVNGMGKMLPF